MMTRYIDLPDMAALCIERAGYENVYLKKLDELTGKTGIVVRRMPSAVTGRDYSGSVSLAFVYQVVVRLKSEVAAMQTASELCQLLDMADIPSGNGSYQFVAQEVYTTPQPLETGEKGFYAQEFRIKALIEIGESHGSRRR